MTAGDLQRLLETIRDQQKLPETSSDYWRPAEYYWRPSETAGDQQRLLEISRDCWRPLETTGDLGRPSQTVD